MSAFKFRQILFITLFMLGLFSNSYSMPALYDFKGEASSIDDFAGEGKWLVVMFWASDCHVCNMEAHQYVDFHFVHSDKDATVLGVSLDGMANKVAAEEFIKKHKINFPP